MCESKSERDDEKSELDSQHSEEAPPEDACKHCGLPNHPELVGHPVMFLNIFLISNCDGRIEISKVFDDDHT